ncbi:MAG TPA: O-antigen ligase family protein [Terriglobales bacterium]|jgi:O-antigen ligase
MRDARYKLFAAGAFVLLTALLVHAAFSSPGSFTDPVRLSGLIFLEGLLVIAWRFERRFLPVLLLIFLASGTSVPPVSVWTSLRWALLAFGSVAGMVLYLKNYHCSFGTFHLCAAVCCITASTSAMFSNSPGASMLKSVSLLLLFLYGAGGARIAILGNPNFPKRLLQACELLVCLTAISYGVFNYSFFGNANSLGAVMGIAVMPVLLWGSIIAETRAARMRRTLIFLLALLLCLDSYSRASISAGLVSCAFLCIGLRRYRLLFKGLAVVGVAALLVITFRPLESGENADSLVNAFVYKGRPEEGILASRKTPWDETIASIQQSPWFGTGFGTSFLGVDQKERVDALRSFAGTSREHGNSYLAIAEWVGLVGIIPFAGLMFLLIRYLWLGFLHMRRSDVASQFFIPVCAIVLAGIVGAFFEDWMFAVGSYLCVFFWSFTFMLPDLLPERLPAPGFVEAPSFHGRSSSYPEFTPAIPGQ